tara:strand:- start:705 stop:863 length:159 start_codon:yes stop_codon:yes gene_type:complete
MEKQSSDRKLAKKILKRAKKNPELYSKEEVRYAKLFRKRTKKLNHESTNQTS